MNKVKQADRNNFQFRNDGSPEAVGAIKILDPTYGGSYEYYGSTHSKRVYGGNKPDPATPIITPSQALKLLTNTEK